MNDFLPSDFGGDADRYWAALTRVQCGIADWNQMMLAGFSRSQVAHKVRSAAWRRVHPRVYATFSGPLSREARMWAAIRWAGPGAMLSHQTAAEIHGMLDERRGASTIHVMVPLRRRPGQHGKARGVVVHRSDLSRPDVTGPFKLPRTMVADTVLDLVAAAETFDHGYSWIARAVSRKLVTAADLRTALALRRRVPWRSWLGDAFAEAGAGTHSPLELRYLHDVERAHGLPRSQRQHRRDLRGKVHYRDNWYADYRLVVEIDGPAYHQNERVQVDKDRDNANLALEDVKTFRFGPVGVTERACETAAMVAATLRRNGWKGAPRRCRRANCALAHPVG